MNPLTYLIGNQQKNQSGCGLGAQYGPVKVNKISLNSGKREVVLFRSKNIKITKNMNFRISGQKINILCKRKYLGITLNVMNTYREMGLFRSAGLFR